MYSSLFYYTFTQFIAFIANSAAISAKAAKYVRSVVVVYGGGGDGQRHKPSTAKKPQKLQIPQKQQLAITP